MHIVHGAVINEYCIALYYIRQWRVHLGANYKKILRLSYDVIITYDNRKSNLR